MFIVRDNRVSERFKLANMLAKEVLKCKNELLFDYENESDISEMFFEFLKKYYVVEKKKNKHSSFLSRLWLVFNRFLFIFFVIFIYALYPLKWLLLGNNQYKINDKIVFYIMRWIDYVWEEI